MDNILIENLINSIKKNKKYRSISDTIIKKEIIAYLKKHPEINSNNDFVVKEIRKSLHRIYSSYQTKKKNKRKKYLLELSNLVKNKSDMIELTNKLLSLTRSTKERINDYSYIYQNIFSITKKPKHIIDLGSGFNVLSFPLMCINSLTYLSYDIDESDIAFLNDYYHIIKDRGLNGSANILDINDLDSLEKLQTCDIIFLFKVLDLIGTKKEFLKNLLEKLFTKSPYIVISFSTKTLSGKQMRLKSRPAFVNIIESMGYILNSFSTSNEIFYIIHKKS